MKLKLLLIVLLFPVFQCFSQNIHSQSNAVNPTNESNSTAGWAGGANLQVDGSNPFSGNFSFRISSTASNVRNVRYNFPAVIGETYEISIWAREGSQSFEPAFANWTGVSGFSTTRIIGTNWAEYTFVVTATSTSPRIQVYTSPRQGGDEGDTVFIDAVSIRVQGSEDLESPQTVTGLEFSDVDNNSVSLNWNSSTDNVAVVNYEIQQNGVPIGTSGGSLSFDVSGLESETSYLFEVIALDEAGNRSAPSNSVSVLTTPDPDVSPPEVVNDLSTSVVNSRDVLLVWTASNDNIAVVDYEIQQDGIAIGNTNGDTSFLVENLTPATSYLFRIVAIDEAGNRSGLSNEIDVLTASETDLSAPDAVNDLSTNLIQGTQVRLVWSEPSDNIGVVDYEVFRDAQSLGRVGNITSLITGGLISCTTYTFSILAYDAAGNASEQSNLLEVETTANISTGGGGAPLPPVLGVSDVNATIVTTNSVALEWIYPDNPENRILDFQIFQDDVLIGTSAGLWSTEINGLEPNTSYSFRIEPVRCQAIASDPGTPFEVTTLSEPDLTPPGSISNLDSSELSDTSVRLSWSAAIDNVGISNYEIFQDDNSIGFTDNLFLSISGLSSETSYTFGVVAIDLSDNRSSVVEINVTTLETPPVEVVDYTSENANSSTVDWNAQNILVDQSIGVGTTLVAGYRVAIGGNLIAEEIKVSLQQNWPDYVFKDSYKLPDLLEVESFINENGHLEYIPSAKEVHQNGLFLGDFNKNLLRTVEELTLYTIEQEKAIKALEKRVKALEDLHKRLELLEKKESESSKIKEY